MVRLAVSSAPPPLAVCCGWGCVVAGGGRFGGLGGSPSERALVGAVAGAFPCGAAVVGVSRAGRAAGTTAVVDGRAGAPTAGYYGNRRGFGTNSCGCTPCTASAERSPAGLVRTCHCRRWVRGDGGDGRKECEQSLKEKDSSSFDRVRKVNSITCDRSLGHCRRRRGRTLVPSDRHWWHRWDRMLLLWRAL